MCTNFTKLYLCEETKACQFHMYSAQETHEVDGMQVEEGEVRPCRLVNNYRCFEKLSVDCLDLANEGSTFMRLTGNYLRVYTTVAQKTWSFINTVKGSLDLASANHVVIEWSFIHVLNTENYPLPSHYAASSGDLLPKFQDNISVPNSSCKNPFIRNR